MQLEAAPVEVEVVFLEQSDQTASLRDVAERSDEVGVETQLHGGIRGCTVPARKRLGGVEERPSRFLFRGRRRRCLKGMEDVQVTPLKT
jgi:hypothetical protein